MQRMLTVVATKADGTWYRTWQAYVERLEDNLLVTVGVPGSRVADRETSAEAARCAWPDHRAKFDTHHQR